MKRATKKETIEPEKMYSLLDISRLQMFSWYGGSYWSVKNAVMRDRRRKNVLQGIITGTGRAKKYHFKGENIINFIKLVNAGEIQPK